LLESPTGSGKSLALLCAVLAWREQHRQHLEQDHRIALEKYEKELKVWTDARIEKSKTTNVASSSSKPKSASVSLYSRLPLAFSGASNIHTEVQDDDFIYPSTFKISSSGLESNNLIEYGTFPKQQEQRPVMPQKKEAPKIYYGSRTHKQIAQVIEELRGNTPYRPKMCVLGSRSQFCVNKQATKSDKGSIDEACVKLVEENKCGFHQGHYLIKTTKLLPPVWDIEDLKVVGERIKACPYFGSRALAEQAELIFCPYNYLLDPLIRPSMQIQLDNAIVILDEAHNIEDMAREVAGCEVTNGHLKSMLQEIDHLHQLSLTLVGPSHLSTAGAPTYANFIIFLKALEMYLLGNQSTFQTVSFENKSNMYVYSPVRIYRLQERICY
jgi:Fanconi anemia group J protein